MANASLEFRSISRHFATLAHACLGGLENRCNIDRMRGTPRIRRWTQLLMVALVLMGATACGRIGYDFGRGDRDAGRPDMAVNSDAEVNDAGRDMLADTGQDLALDSAQDAQTDMAIGSTPIQIYRSVGAGNRAPLISGGANRLNIVGTTATFLTPLPDNVGVGDALQYDSDGNSSIDAIAFIHGRVSSTVYVVAAASGETPTATTDERAWDVFRAYASLGNAESGGENSGIDVAVRDFDAWTLGNDLVANNQQWNVACYSDAVDTGHIIVDDWTTGPNNYFRIFTPYLPTQVGVTQRHRGTWDSGGYAIELSMSGHSVETRVPYTIIEGLRVQSPSEDGNFSYGIRLRGAIASQVHIRNNIVRKGLGVGSDQGGIFARSSARQPSYVYNNIVYGFSSAGAFGIFAGSDLSGGPSLIFNNTVVDCDAGIVSGYDDAVLRNNLVYQTTMAFPDNYASGSDNNATDNDDDTTGVLNTPTNDRRSQAFVFVNAAGADYHLHATDTGATGFGADLSAHPDLPISDDIDNDNRMLPWDIGADAP